MTTTRYQMWIASLQERDIQSIAQLHRAVDSETTVGIFTVTKNETGFHVRARGQEITLRIATKQAKVTFLETLERDFNPGRLKAAVAITKKSEIGVLPEKGRTFQL